LRVSYLPFGHIVERLFSLYAALWKHSHVYFCPS
jgi:long-subunit acyl-CoA synthetase (AMP-forming)